MSVTEAAAEDHPQGPVDDPSPASQETAMAELDETAPGGDRPAPVTPSGQRAAVVGRVLAGELTEQEGAELLGVPREQLVRWKAEVLEHLDDGHPAQHEVDEHSPAPRPDARPPAVERRLVAAATVGIIGLVTAFAIARPTGLTGLELFDAVNRWVLYAGTLFAVGGVLFLWRIHDGGGTRREHRSLRWWTEVAALVAVATSLIALSVHAAAIAGVGPAAMVDHHEVGRAADGAFGASTVLRLLGLIYIVYALRRRAGSLSGMMVAITGALLTLGSFLLIGHTATGEPRLLVLVSDLVHTLAAGGWFGGLVLLAMSLRHRRASADTAGAATMVGRFSTFAAVSVAALFASGTAMATTEIPTWGGLVGHEYGLTVLSKAGLVLVILAAATYNHRTLLPRLRQRQADDPAAWQRLRATMMFEVSGLVVVLLVTALLVNLGSPG